MPQGLITALVYVSTAAAGLGRAELEAIERAALKNNLRNGVTGLLAFNGTNFMQLIEGTPAAVGNCAHVIERDERHSGMSILSHQTAAQRQFPDWTMATCFLEKDNRSTSQLFENLLTAPTVDDQTRQYFNSFHSLGYPK